MLIQKPVSFRRFTSLLLLLPALLLFWRLDYAAFWNPDEGRYAAASREMAFGLGTHQPDWLVPHLNTITRLNKPPLIYWLVGGAFRFWGPSEWSGRLVPALAALAVLIVVFLWGRAAFGLKAGLIAALVWVTSALPFAMARTLNTDMLLTAAITLSLWGLFGSVRVRESLGGRESMKARAESGIKSVHLASALCAGCGMGLALLTKGPVGVAMPLGIYALYTILTRKTEPLSLKALSMALGLALLVTLLIGVPWYVAVQSGRPAFLRTFLLSENLGRFSGSKNYHDKTPVWYYLPIVMVGLLPWTGFAVGIFTRWVRNEEEGQARLFLWLWAGLLIGFFSLSSTKLISYVLPAFPALALLLGAALTHWGEWALPIRRLALGATLLLQSVLLVALLAVPGKDKATKRVILQPGLLRDDKTVPRRESESLLGPLASVLGAGTLLLVAAARRGCIEGIVAVQGLTVGAVYLFVAPLAGTIARYEDGSAVFLALRPLLQPADRIVTYKTFVPTGIFYADRPVTNFDFSNSSGLPEQELSTSPWFPRANPQTLAPFFAAPTRVFWITRGPAPHDWQTRLTFWGRNNNFFLYANRPRPVEFNLDSVAPDKRRVPNFKIS